MTIIEFIKTLWVAGENLYYKFGQVWLLIRNGKTLINIGEYHGYRKNYTARMQCLDDLNRLIMIKKNDKKAIKNFRFCADAAQGVLNYFEAAGGVAALCKNNLIKALSYANLKESMQHAVVQKKQ